MSALVKIRKAGFTVNLNETGIEIRPASSLSQHQRDFLKIHRAEIISELRIEQARRRFSHWQILCKGKKREITISPPHTIDEMKHIYRGATSILPLT